MGFRQNGLEIPPEVTTLPEALRDLGYSTHLVGKWHAGEIREASLPLAQGFDTFFGFHNQWELSGAVTAENRGRQRPTYLNPWLREGTGELQQRQGHLTDILAERTLQIIRNRASDGEPWFLYHGFLAPHAPIEPAERFSRLRTDDPEGRYLALVDHIDEVVGAMMGALRETGQDRDTLVVFVSDNGGTNLERDNNYPWYGKKDETYEGSFRTPLLMRFPGGEHGGQQASWVVMNTDIFPTVLAVAGGIAPGDLDGENLLSSIATGRPTPRKPRSWEKYIWNVDSMTYSFLSGDGRWRLSNLYGMPPWLYDLQDRPEGDQDIADSELDQRDALMQEFRLAAWQKSLLSVRSERDDAADSTAYTGADLNRTPYRHSFAIGLEIPPHPSPRDSQLYAEQRGAWRLAASDGKHLLLEVGNLRVKAPLLDHTRCNDIVISGHFQPPAMFVKTEASQLVKLYVNGELNALADGPAFEPPGIEATANPTVVFGGGRAVFSNLLLGAPADPFTPSVAVERRELYYDLRRQGRLQRMPLQPMRERLCQDPPAEPAAP